MGLYTVVAILAYHPDKDEGGGVIRGGVKVLAIFPHSSQCTCPHSSRRNYIMSRENGGTGWLLINDYPVEAIVGQTYNPIIDKLNSIEKGGQHFGENHLCVCIVLCMCVHTIFACIYIIYPCGFTSCLICLTVLLTFTFWFLLQRNPDYQ